MKNVEQLEAEISVQREETLDYSPSFNTGYMRMKCNP